MTFKDVYLWLALLCAIPGAWLSFKKSFIRDFQDQMIGMENPAGVGTATINLVYKLLAPLMIGPRNRWLELFDPTARSKLIQEDKTSALRIFMWFTLMFIFSFLSWWFSD